ncbi:MAG: hypothetical protein NPIRA06_05440 [Nitrospirales bacterium]|nr:MAG: hypothetical protein NPIRA06_05440 [Nitrospirales bacterium]
MAEDIGVSKSTIQSILRGRDPESLGIWKKLARYFHVDMELLRFGHFAFIHPPMKDEGRANGPQPYRKVPILSWTQVRHVVEGHDSKFFLAAGQGMVETELTGARVFAMHVEDDSMEPLFHVKEIIFVNPDLRPQSGDYVVVLDQMAEADHGCLRQLKRIQKQYILQPLNLQYQDVNLASHQKIVGRVVRLRMNL